MTCSARVSGHGGEDRRHLDLAHALGDIEKNFHVELGEDSRGVLGLHVLVHFHQPTHRLLFLLVVLDEKGADRLLDGFELGYFLVDARLGGLQ